MTDLPELPGLPEGWAIPDTIAAITDRDEDPLPSQSGSVQVIPAIAIASGSPYVCTVQPSDDVAIELTRGQALQYAGVVFNAAMQSVYLAGIRAQMTDVFSKRGRVAAPGDTVENVEWMVNSFASDVLPPENAVTGPLTFQPGYRPSTGEPLVKVVIGDDLVATWSPASARHHANAVMIVAFCAELDTAYKRFAIANIGVAENQGRAMVHDLGHYLQHFDGLDPEVMVAAAEAALARRKPPVVMTTPRPGARPAGKRKGRR